MINKQFILLCFSLSFAFSQQFSSNSNGSNSEKKHSNRSNTPPQFVHNSSQKYAAYFIEIVSINR